MCVNRNIEAFLDSEELSGRRRWDFWRRMWPQQWLMELSGFWRTFSDGVYSNRRKKLEKLILEELKTIPFSISYDRQQHRRRRSGSFCTDSLSLWCWGSLDIWWFEAAQCCLLLEEDFDKPTNWPDVSSELHSFGGLWWNRNTTGKGRRENERAVLKFKEVQISMRNSCIMPQNHASEQPEWSSNHQEQCCSFQVCPWSILGKCEGKMSSFPSVITVTKQFIANRKWVHCTVEQILDIF